MSLQEIKYDSNKHRINQDGSLVFDPECEECRKARPQKEDSHRQEFIET